MTSTERGAAAWLEWKKSGVSPKMTKCVICRIELRTDQPAPVYLVLDDEEFEIFFPVCLSCGRKYRGKAISDTAVIETVEELKKAAG